MVTGGIYDCRSKEITESSETKEASGASTSRDSTGSLSLHDSLQDSIGSLSLHDSLQGSETLSTLTGEAAYAASSNCRDNPALQQCCNIPSYNSLVP